MSRRRPSGPLLVLPLLIAAAAAGCGSAEREPPSVWTRQIGLLRAGQTDSLGLTMGPLIAGDLAPLAEGCERLVSVTIRQTPPGPVVCEGDGWGAAFAEVLPALPNLRRVDCDAALDAGAFAVEGAPPLEHLNLPRAAADDADAAALAGGLPSLTLLRLHAPGLTDAGAASLVRLPNLRFLHLIDAPLTDAAVPDLAACGPLESLYLDGSRLSAEGWAELHRLRPDLHLHAELTHPTGGPPHE